MRATSKATLFLTGLFAVFTAHSAEPDANAAQPAQGDATSAVLGVLKWIPAGTFQMGSPSSEPGRDDDERQHSVTLSSGYWMMEREVSQGMWRSVTGTNPSEFTYCGDDCPVEQVSWTEAVDFARRLSAQEGVNYRLPTEAEWEYAARGGEVFLYAGSSDLTSVGWVNKNSDSQTHPSCQKARNGYGLCDMAGNVWEWTGDWFGEYPTSAVTDPTGPISGPGRVLRSGCWFYIPAAARVANRNDRGPATHYDALGFRLVRTNP